MARPVHCAAVDLGATSGRVMVGTWQDGRVTLREARRFPNAFRTLAGHDYWDIGGLWHEVQAGLADAAAALPSGERLASVGVDTWGVDHALLDARGRLVFPVHAYRDARTQPGLARLDADARTLARIYAATGIPNLFYNTSLQLAETVERFPVVRRLAERCLFLPDYFNFLLSGRMENELSISSTSQLLGVDAKAAWSGTALRQFGIPGKWFAPPVPGMTPLGPVRGPSQLAGTQVVAVPGHDTACAYDAMPVAADEAALFISAGTWSLVGFESPEPVQGSAALAAGIANERTGDGRFRPLRNVIGLWLLEGLLKEFDARPTNEAGWTRLLRAAEAKGRPEELLAVDDPAFVNPPSMRAAVDAQLRRRHLPIPGDLAGYVRLACESLGEGHAAAMRLFERLSGRRFDRIVMVGGGARNRLLCQATADAAGVPLLAAQLEGSAMGNIGRQLIALGLVADVNALRSTIRQGLTIRRYDPA